MEKNSTYKKYIKIAFYLNMVGIVLTFTTKGNIAVFGTILIIIALILAVIVMFKKKQYEKKS